MHLRVLEDDFSREEEPGRRMRRPRLPKFTRNEVIGASLVALAFVGGGKSGYEMAQNSERIANQQDLREAAQYRDCKEVVHRVKRTGSTDGVVRLSMLTQGEKKACGVDNIAVALQKDTHDTTDEAHIPAVVAKIEIDELAVRLPSETELAASEQNATAASAFNNNTAIYGGIPVGVLVLGFALPLVLAGSAAVIRDGY